MSDQYHIAGLVVHCRQEAVLSVRDAIRQIAGTEIHAQSDEGKLVVTLEQDSSASLQMGMHEISLLPGVLTASLTYHRVENLDDERE